MGYHYPITALSPDGGGFSKSWGCGNPCYKPWVIRSGKNHFPRMEAQFNTIPPYGDVYFATDGSGRYRQLDRSLSTPAFL